MLFAGQQPGWDEDRLGRNFVGESGQLLAEDLANAGLPRDVTRAFLNVVRCAAGHAPTQQEIKHCLPFLLRDLEEVQPKLVIPLGNDALRATLKMGGIGEKHGKVVSKDGIAYLPTYNPAFLLREPGKRRDFQSDIVQAVRILDTLAGRPDRNARLVRRYQVIRTEAQAWKFLEECCHHAVLTIDTEYSPKDYLEDPFVLLSIQAGWKPKQGVFFPWRHPESPWVDSEPLLEAFAEVWRYLLTTKGLVEHNAEADTGACSRAFNIPISQMNVVLDTMTSSICLNGVEASHTLKSRSYVVADTGGYDAAVEAWKAEREAAGLPTTFDHMPLKTLSLPYGAADVDTTTQCAIHDVAALKAQNQWDFYQRVLRRNHRLNLLMRRRGLLLDWDQWAVRERYWREARTAAREAALAIPAVAAYATELEAATGKRFTLGSDDQMRACLFTVMGLTPSRRQTDKTGLASLDKKAKQEIARLNPDGGGPLIRAMNADSYAETMHSRYVLGYAKERDNKGNRVCWPDGRLHPRFHTFTASLRRGSSSPNAQNIPYGKGPDAGTAAAMDNMRMLIRATPDYRFVTVDYGALEYRLGACYSRDPAMIAGCQPGADPHKIVMDRLGVPRKLAKLLNYGFIYGAGGEKIADEIAEKTNGEILWSAEQGQEYVDRLWNEVYPTLRDTRDGVHAAIRQNGYATTIAGHRRPLPGVWARERGVIEAALREGWNFLIQGAGHAALEVGLQWMQDQIEAHGLDWHLLIDTHDGAVYEVPEGDEADCAALLKIALEQIGPRIYPPGWQIVDLPVEITTGEWYGALSPLP